MNRYSFNKIGLNKFINLEKFGLSSFALKIIATVSMLIDHIGKILFVQSPQIYKIMHAVGRLSFPLYCFLLVEGLIHTKNRLKHAILLFVFAIVSEFPYDLTKEKWEPMSEQSIMCLLFIGFVSIWILDSVKNREKDYPNALETIFGNKLTDWIIRLLVIVGGTLIVYYGRIMSGPLGFWLIILLYTFREGHGFRVLSNLGINLAMALPLNKIQILGGLAIIPMELYNEKPGKYKWKYFFYLFYPVHLLALVSIKMLLK